MFLPNLRGLVNKNDRNLIVNQITNQKRFIYIIAILYYIHVRCIADCEGKDLSISRFRFLQCQCKHMQSPPEPSNCDLFSKHLPISLHCIILLLFWLISPWSRRLLLLKYIWYRSYHRPFRKYHNIYRKFQQCISVRFPLFSLCVSEWMSGSLHSLYPLYPLTFNTGGYNRYNKKSLRRDLYLLVAILATISTQMKRECFSLYLLSSDLAKVDKSTAI